ncbi:hypothetical protein R1sor_026332 [Riccia sorocarpa]|uniref:Uncharacterized protein n=1 Tax=Riccia sorocarpa TaxID=122646 RepID=A0ABD3GGR3_9MARC
MPRAFLAPLTPLSPLPFSHYSHSYFTLLILTLMDPLTVEVREEDIPVAAVQVPPIFVVDEVPLGENPMEVAPVPASDHGVDEGKFRRRLSTFLTAKKLSL